MSIVGPSAIRRIQRRDRAARWVITLGGLTVLGSVVAILVLILGVTLPLFRPARVHQIACTPLPASIRPEHVLAIGVELALDGQSAVAHVLTADGAVSFIEPHSGEILTQHPSSPPAPTAKRVIAAERRPGTGPEQDEPAVHRNPGMLYSLVWSDGSMSLIEVSSRPEFNASGQGTLQHEVRRLAAEPWQAAPLPLAGLMRISGTARGGAATGRTLTTVRLLPDGRIAVSRQVTEEDLAGQETTSSKTFWIDARGLAPITAITMDSNGTALYAGTQAGQLARWRIEQDGVAVLQEVVHASQDQRPITALAMVLGDVSLAVGDGRGELATWFAVRYGQTASLRRIHSLRSHPGAVREILPSIRTKSLASFAQSGSLYLDHMTSQRNLVSLRPDPPLVQIGASPRGDGLIALDAANRLIAWRVDAPHPEVSWKTLWASVHYEGYDRPALTWQTTGGEDYEPKLSLVPLFWGTLKGTFYAMLLAVPLALFGAVYTSQFAAPGFQAAIKSAVELMASVPSVVIGLLAALWLAPLLERWILAGFLSLVTVPLVFVLFMGLWQAGRRLGWAKRVEDGYEFLAVVPAIASGLALAGLLVSPTESGLFGGDFKRWLYQTLAMPYDHRNCILVAFALGLAVIPIIFSIAEDALSSVPHNLTAASVALGASRWQTVRRVVLPSASPGIFAAIMIGTGRAVGETMIVLMATGNTPILDWSPLNGMRTLSANIAVEIPEAPVGGTLYRVLFLCAVLLFLLTFTLNTAAELVRQRLRKRYGRL
ncbi:MAG: ABC transporter permease subunit [Thermoguttaceae bacterium]